MARVALVAAELAAAGADAAEIVATLRRWIADSEIHVALDKLEYKRNGRGGAPPTAVAVGAAGAAGRPGPGATCRPALTSGPRGAPILGA